MRAPPLQVGAALSVARQARATVFAAVGMTACAAVVVLVALRLAPNSPPVPGSPFEFTTPGLLCLIAVVVAGWLVVIDHPISAAGLILVSVASALPGLAAWSVPSAQLRAALLAASPLAVGGVALVTAGWRPQPTGVRILAAASLGLAFVSAAVHLLGYNPFADPGCSSTCESSTAIVASAIGTRSALGVSTVLLVLASAGVVVISWRCRATPNALRAGSTMSALLVTAAAFAHWASWTSAATPALEERLQALGAAVVALPALFVALHTRRVRRKTRDVLDRLAGSASLGGAAGAVTDIHFAVPYESRLVNSEGRHVQATECARCAILADVNGPSVHLVLDRRADHDEVLSLITPADLLGLENARLRAASLARLADLAASQRRIVEVADLERRRIEHDLHDGAQQRLVAVAMHLNSSRRPTVGTTARHLAAGEELVRHALSALRDLSHDSLAAVLTTEGLAAAVEEIAWASPLDVDLNMSFDAAKVPPAVQAAAYLTIKQGLGNVVAHSGGNRARVALLEDNAQLVAEVADDGHGGAVIGGGLTDIADRIGALGGQFQLNSSPRNGTTLTVRLPCES
jgi:signal transduction histidine kinase